MPQYGWLLDEKRCIECRACEAACKQWNNLDPGIQFRKVRTFEIGKYPAVKTQALSWACNHCDRPYCMFVCPTKAISRRAADGAVLIDPAKCIGCGVCQDFCPYGALVLNPKTKKMMKCTMCVDRLDAGLQPACSSICPTGALQFVPVEEMEQKGNVETTNFPYPHSTRPRIRFVENTWKGSSR
jgi:anaerobic dimethyl sulfoxide reductase subunit B (iron-sulfur subunit)